MITRNRTLSVVAALAATIAVTAAPAYGAFDAADPNPLRQAPLLRVGAIAANGDIAAIGYREGASPGKIKVAWSKDAGATYLKGNGKLRKFSVAGLGRFGVSLDICDETIWVATAAKFPGDRGQDSDVLVSRRLAKGGAGQAFITSPSRNRLVRSAEVACIGKDFIAVAWLEKIGGESRARLIIQDQDSLAPASFKKSYNLGAAVLDGGISVAATSDSVYVAWTRGKARNVKYQRFQVGGGAEPEIIRDPVVNVAKADALWPQLAVHAERVALAYTDAGKVKVRVSTDGGASFGPSDKIIAVGKKGKPSRPWSIDIKGQRVVVEAGRNVSGTTTPVRVQTVDLGGSWQTSTFGHKGARYGALQRVGDSSSLKEAWHNNGSQDTLRAQHEV